MYSGQNHRAANDDHYLSLRSENLHLPSLEGLLALGVKAVLSRFFDRLEIITPGCKVLNIKRFCCSLLFI